jgi:tRNA-dihydrouridine synthase
MKMMFWPLRKGLSNLQKLLQILRPSYINVNVGCRANNIAIDHSGTMTVLQLSLMKLEWFGS